MCGRFVITHPSAELARLFEAAPANDLPDVPNYNICPTNRIHVVTSTDGSRQLRAMRWGFLPHWAKAPTDGPLLINARAETLAEKPAFRAAARERRCLVPASGFYEWTKDPEGHRLPWYIHPPNGALLTFAGIWQEWSRGGDTIVTCAIVTTAAAGKMTGLHHRVPVCLAADDWALWLGEAGHGAAALMTSPAEGALNWHRVDPKVNSNRAAGADLILPLVA